MTSAGRFRQSAVTLLGALGALLHAVLVYADVELTEVPVELGVGLGKRDKDFMQMQFEAEPRWDFTLGERGSAVTSFRLRLDGEDELEPGAPKFANYSPLSKPLLLGDNGTIELRDVYYEHRLDSGLVRIGKQQIVWGRLDGIKILDVLNPQTFREFILDDLEDSRIGLWSAYLDRSLGSWRAEFTLIPDITSHDIPEPGAWFELRAPRFRFGAPADREGLPLLVEREADVFEDVAFGARFSRYLGGVDVSALAYTGRDHEPLGRVVVDDGTPAVETYYRRREVLGLSAESSLGPVAWRAELSYQPERSFNLRESTGLSETELDQITVGLGADMQLPLDFFANLQLVWDHVNNTPEALIRPGEDQILTLFLRRNFAYETLRTEFRWYHSLTEYDDTYVATARYEISDTTSAYVSGEWFRGTPEGLFGQFAPQDRIVFGLTRYF
jgi:hypothetical protein